MTSSVDVASAETSTGVGPERNAIHPNEEGRDLLPNGGDGARTDSKQSDKDDRDRGERRRERSPSPSADIRPPSDGPGGSIANNIDTGEEGGAAVDRGRPLGEEEENAGTEAADIERFVMGRMKMSASPMTSASDIGEGKNQPEGTDSGGKGSERGENHEGKRPTPATNGSEPPESKKRKSGDDRRPQVAPAHFLHAINAMQYQQMLRAQQAQMMRAQQWQYAMMAAAAVQQQQQRQRMANGANWTAPLPLPNPSNLGRRADKDGHVVQLTLPSGNAKLGMCMEDGEGGMPEVRALAPDSVLWDQIPARFRSGFRIAWLRVQGENFLRRRPRTAVECAGFIAGARGGSRRPFLIMEFCLLEPGGSPRSEAAGAAETVAESSGDECPGAAAGPSQRQVGNRNSSSSNASKPRGAKRKSSVPTGAPRQNENAPVHITRSKGAKIWKRQYNALADHYQLNGNHDIPASTELAVWVREQKKEKKANRLHNKRVEYLDDINFNWDIEDASDCDDGPDNSKPSNNRSKNPHPKLTWDERYESLVMFKAKCDLFPTSGSLYNWLKAQKKSANKLSCDCVRKLHELGVELNLPREKLLELGCAPGGGADDASGKDGADAANSPGKKESKKRSRLKDGSNGTGLTIYWNSAEAAQLFGFDRGDDILKGLRERIDTLRKVNESIDGWKSIVPNDGKEDLYNEGDIVAVRQKALFLIRAYVLAMKNMNEKSWGGCCDVAAEELNELGLAKGSSTLISNWNVQYRKKKVFPHPKKLLMEKVPRTLDRIFEFFPTAKERFIQIAKENQHRLSGKFMTKEFATTILPELEKESRDRGCFDDGSDGQKMLIRMIAQPPSDMLVTKWMRMLNIEWDYRALFRGRNGTSQHSTSMRAAWASGKYAGRRPKGQGLKKGKKSSGDGQGDENIDSCDQERDDLIDEIGEKNERSDCEHEDNVSGDEKMNDNVPEAVFGGGSMFDEHV